MRNCPIDYYQECSNANKKCKVCSAGNALNASGNVYFEPIEGSDKTVYTHPHWEIVKELREANREEALTKTREKKDRSYIEKSRVVKAGLKSEKYVAERIVKGTVKSGAVHRDGDYSILDGLAQADHKLRTKTKNFNLKWEEYKKGIATGTDHWLISVIDEHGNTHTVVSMTLEAYTRLLSLAKEER
jgi:hypothetical protein